MALFEEGKIVAKGKIDFPATSFPGCRQEMMVWLQ
jgi:hypothetical protein